MEAEPSEAEVKDNRGLETALYNTTGALEL
jgi:hypothetical protein